MPEELIVNWLGENAYYLLAMFFLLLFRSGIERAFHGLIFYYDKSFEEDQLVILNGRKARIVKIGLSKTVFYMYDRRTRLHLPNEKIRSMTLEKVLLKPESYDLQNGFAEEKKWLLN